MRKTQTITIAVVAVMALAFTPVVFGGPGERALRSTPGLETSVTTPGFVDPLESAALHQTVPNARAAAALGSGDASTEAQTRVTSLSETPSPRVSQNQGKGDGAQGVGNDNGQGSANRGWPKKYLEETKKELVDNGQAAEADVESMCEAALGDGSASAAGRLPGVPGDATVIAASPRRGWANVFDADGTPVYFFYADVEIEERGLRAARTVEIPMVRGASQWVLSDLGIQTPGLLHVQSVEF